MYNFYEKMKHLQELSKTIIGVFLLHENVFYSDSSKYVHSVLWSQQPCVAGGKDWAYVFSETSSNVIFKLCSKEPVLNFMTSEAALCSFSYLLQCKGWDYDAEKRSFYTTPWYGISSANKILCVSLFFRPDMTYMCSMSLRQPLYRWLSVLSNLVFAG